MSFDKYKSIWVAADFEFRAAPGECPEPVCMAAREIRSRRTVTRMITLEQAKLHLRVDGTDEDVPIQATIDASTAAPRDFLNFPICELSQPVEAAILLQVGDLYSNGERQGDKQYFANSTYERQLNPYRAMNV